MSETHERLFGYLRDVIYAPDKAELDIDQLDSDAQKLGHGLTALAHMLHEQRAFASALARGDLDAPAPGRKNELAAQLKALQASLKHLTWQTQQVAKGDYHQRVDFMGAFSEAFNAMTEQLEAREHTLELEIEAGRQRAMALEQVNRLLTTVTAGIAEALFVVGDDGRVFYQNHAAQKILTDESVLEQAMRAAYTPCGGAGMRAEFSMVEGAAAGRTFAVQAYAIEWAEQKSIAYVLGDVSEEKARLNTLEHRANRDALTGLFNRFYGMRMLQEWTDRGEPFSLCFIDMDNLKYVNDVYGHAEGDYYIVALANLLSNVPMDIVASRIGGDEFMLLCPCVDMEKGRACVESLRSQLKARVAADGKPYYVNISYGIAEYGEGGLRTGAQMLRLADERMYVNKQQQKRARSV